MRRVRAHGLEWVDVPGTDAHVGTRGHEEWLWAVLCAQCPWDGVFVNVGAHVGLWALRMTAKCARVIAFEPCPVTRGYLLENIAHNGASNIEVRPVGLGSASEVRHLSAGSYEGPDLFYSRGHIDGPGGGWDVKLNTADQELAGLPRIDLMLLDCEGWEAEVLRGAQEVLMRLRPRLIIESHAVLGTDERLLDETLRLLEGAAYDHSRIAVDHPQAYVHAWPR
mgnify:CR=1 FL=1